MLKSTITRIPDSEADGFARIELKFTIADDDREKWTALGIFLANVLPYEEALELLKHDQRGEGQMIAILVLCALAIGFRAGQVFDDIRRNGL